MSILERLRKTQLSPRIAVFSIVGLVVVMSGVVVMVRKMADTSPALAVKPAGINASAEEKKDKAETKAAAEARTEDPYAIIVERNLFKPVTAASLASDTAKPAPPPAPPKPPLPPMPVPAPSGNIDEVKKNIAFTGSVQIAGVQQALLENLQTKETRYTSQGESAFGYRVMTVSSQLVVLEKNGLQFTLTMGEGKPDAPAAAPKPGEQKPGQPGGPEGQPRQGG